LADVGALALDGLAAIAAQSTRKYSMSTGAKRAMSDPEKENQAEVSAPARPSDRDRRERGGHRQRNKARHLEASINMAELRELVTLITKNELTHFELEREGFHVKVSRGPQVEGLAPLASAASPAPEKLGAGVSSGQGVPTAPPHPGAQAEEAASEDQDLHIITSPIIGTFYRSPSPTAESFVRIGSKVEPTTVVCIIEAMKLMNEIQAETAGEVVKIYVENGQAVEYGQPLFGIKT
jgi:acetyl-CoA carboxylase biotin carboxyl carrier protein